MDTRGVLQERLEAIAQIKGRGAVAAARALLEQRQVKCAARSIDQTAEAELDSDL